MFANPIKQPFDKMNIASESLRLNRMDERRPGTVADKVTYHLISLFCYDKA